MLLSQGKMAVGFPRMCQASRVFLGDGTKGPAWPLSVQKAEAIGLGPAGFPLKCGHVWQGS